MASGSIQTGCGQDFSINFGTGIEAFQHFDVNFIIFDTTRRSETFTAHEREAAEERQVTTLAIKLTARALTDGLAFCTFTGGLTLTGTRTAAYTFFGAFCSEIRL